MKHWTKKEFIKELEPCGYEFKIWWFFLRHKHITLLNIINARGVSVLDKLWATIVLDWDLYAKYRVTHSRKYDLAMMRAELKKAT